MNVLEVIKGPKDLTTPTGRKAYLEALRNASVNTAKVKGWLDEDGICQFPKEAIEVVNGYQARGIPDVGVLTEDELLQQVFAGRIVFEDGNGDFFTFDQYVLQYPDVPDPIWMLEHQKVHGRPRWPPNPIQLG
jgi:hypothetical protein